ncbi:hypothetical protein WA026_022764 [Henosepilachna vigintioctopunctata]|uniref:Uncharacterized protein n=1 Tax=Henosepilachna vigintioctopunctata TaxID=420089 RepID=A0AAW1UJ39_9CUCU
MSKGEAGFRATGIYPINPNIFSDEDFLPAEILQSEPVVVQDFADSISESNAAETVVSISVPAAAVEPERENRIPQSFAELATASSSQLEIAMPSTSVNLPSIQNLIKMPEKILILREDKEEKF